MLLIKRKIDVLEEQINILENKIDKLEEQNRDLYDMIVKDVVDRLIDME